MFFTEINLPKRKHDRDYEFKDRDWFVGDQDRFTYIFRWYINDYAYVKTTHPIPRVDLRKWCCDNCAGDILVLDGLYSTKLREPRWNDSGDAATFYVDIMFDNMADAVLFKLAWWDAAHGALEEMPAPNKLKM